MIDRIIIPPKLSFLKSNFFRIGSFALKKIKFQIVKFEKDILYIWVGGSCDYGHKERAGGGAYIAQRFLEESKDGAGAETVQTYTCADFDTKEFQMIYRAMDHALAQFGEQNSLTKTSLTESQAKQKIVFLSNVQYIQNYPKHENVEIKILPYHKFPQQKEVHDLASEAMKQQRDAAK